MNEIYIILLGVCMLKTGLFTIVWCNPLPTIKKDTLLIKTRCMMTKHYDHFKEM